MPKFNEKEINVTATEAQPLIKPYFGKKIDGEFPPQEIHPNENLPIFFCNMHCVYPEDRGQNFSLKLKKLVSDKINNFIK